MNKIVLNNSYNHIINCMNINEEVLLMIDNEEKMHAFVDYLYSHEDYYDKWVNVLKNNSNLHLRYLFMKEIIINHQEDFLIIFPFISMYLTNKVGDVYTQRSLFVEIFNEQDASDLMFLIMNKFNNDKINEELKKFIVDYYANNELFHRLLAYRFGVSFNIEKIDYLLSCFGNNLVDINSYREKAKHNSDDFGLTKTKY